MTKTKPTTAIKRLAYAVGLCAISGAANATPCDSALSSYSFYVGIGDTTNANWVLSNHPECFGGGQSTSLTQISGTSFTMVNTISTALAARFLAMTPGPRAAAGTKSMAAGTPGKSWNVWGSIASSDTRQRYTAANGAISRNDSDILTTVIGADYALSPTMTFGVSGAFDRGSGSGLNEAPGNTPNNLHSDGYLIAPYFGMQLSKELALDVSAGLGQGKLSQTGSVTSEADRWFAGANLSYSQWMNNIQLTGKLGYMHGEEDYGNSKVAGATINGTAAKNKIDQLRAGVQAGYWMNGMMPYAGLAYSADLRRTTTQFGAASDPIGKGAWIWTVGVNFFSLASGVTGGIAYNQEEGRTNQKNNSLMANVNFRF